VDLFDCVVPTRNGRHGVVFTRAGRLNLRNARFRDDPGPLDPDCACPVCARHSRAYLRHLIASSEALGSRLVSLHNIAHYMSLLAEIRRAISEDRFGEWFKEWLKVYRARSAGRSSDAADSAA